jgi:hypothetical protein
MSAPKRIPDEAIRRAITDSKGNVAAAALRTSANNLRTRLFNLGVELEALRTGAKATTVCAGIGTKRRPTPPRVTPEHQELLREAKFDLMAHFRRDVDETGVLQAFIDEEFLGWLKRKLGGDQGRAS